MSRSTTCFRFICLWVVLLTVTVMIHISKDRLLINVKKDNSSKRPLIVLGILTTDGKSELRKTQRKTWLTSIRTLKDELPFRIIYNFWFDNPTQESIQENNHYGDIEYLNVTSHGRAFGFGEKLYVWFKYIQVQYPDAMLGLRVDDDVFVCVPQVFKKLDKIKSKKLYYGWAPGKGNKLGRLRYVDEMFVVTGMDLIERIARRKYCNTSIPTCDENTQLIEVGYGGVSLSIWLSIYFDVEFYPDNNHLSHHDRWYKGNRSTVITKDFCKTHLVHHKSTTNYMRTLHDFNSIPDLTEEV